MLERLSDEPRYLEIRDPDICRLAYTTLSRRYIDPQPVLLSKTDPTAMAPQITLYFLQASRCIRTAWQLHELGLDYDLKYSDRVGGLAPPEFRKEAGGLGKFPTIVDNGVTVTESGNIAE